MKTSELTGAELDYWVARAEGWNQFRDFGGSCWGVDCRNKTVYVSAFKPSTDLVQGRAIIQREGIEYFSNGGDSRPEFAWYALTPGLFRYYGPNLLVAAMRAYVASKFGAELAK